MDCFSVDENYEKDYNEWLAKYLLDLEALNKTPPNSTFSGQRGRFEIQFETERFQKWVRIQQHFSHHIHFNTSFDSNEMH